MYTPTYDYIHMMQQMWLAAVNMTTRNIQFD